MSLITFPNSGKTYYFRSKIPDELVVDLNDTEINTSLKISSVKLPENVVPTITDRDFVIATVVAPTILIEPEKVEETTAEGEVPTEGTIEGTEDTAKAEENKDKTPEDKAKGGTSDKGKSAKPSDNKTKAAPSDKGKVANKETKKK